jgi:hypothetical protein
VYAIINAIIAIGQFSLIFHKELGEKLGFAQKMMTCIGLFLISSIFI